MQHIAEMVACNSDSSEKLFFYVISKFLNPPSLKNAKKLPVEYIYIYIGLDSMALD